MSVKVPTAIRVMGPALAVALLMTAAESAVAAFPGASNGQIAFVSDRDPLGSGNTQVFVMARRGEPDKRLDESRQ